jgi:hypothetical protein
VQKNYADYVLMPAMHVRMNAANTKTNIAKNVLKHAESVQKNVTRWLLNQPG